MSPLAEPTWMCLFQKLLLFINLIVYVDFGHSKLIEAIWMQINHIYRENESV